MMNTHSGVTILAFALFAPTAGSAVGSQETALTKHEIEFVWILLERDARASADAGFLLYLLHRQGGDTLGHGWDKFRCGRLVHRSMEELSSMLSDLQQRLRSRGH